MHCAALQFRWGGNNRVSEEELEQLCETKQVLRTQESPGFYFILLWQSVDAYHWQHGKNWNPASLFNPWTCYWSLDKQFPSWKTHLFPPGSFLLFVIVSKPAGTLKSSRCPARPHHLEAQKDHCIVSSHLFLRSVSSSTTYAGHSCWHQSEHPARRDIQDWQMSILRHFT